MTGQSPNGRGKRTREIAARIGPALGFADLLGRIQTGLNISDATISRTAARAIGPRNMQKALMRALRLPPGQLKQAAEEFDFTTGFMLTEALKNLPFATVWAEVCGAWMPLAAELSSPISTLTRASVVPRG